MHVLALAAITLAAACAAPPPPTTTPPPELPPESVRPVASLVPPVPPAERKLMDHERACDEDTDLWSCTIAGMTYHWGDDDEHVAIDVPKAVHYLERGCDGRIAEACAMLIQIYEGVHGEAAQDLDRANRLVMRLCGDGHDDFCKRVRAPVLE